MSGDRLGLTIADLAERTGLPARLLSRILTELVVDGLLENLDGRYRLTLAADKSLGAALRELGGGG